MVSAIVVETERLLLREWDDERWAAFVAGTNTPAVMRWLGGVFSPEQMVAARARLDSYASDHGFTFWAVERKADGGMLGFCGLKRTQAPGGEHLHGAMEIGWRLREEAWGKGYASEAARASLDLAFTRFAAPFVIALTVPGNRASQKVMERLGMRRTPYLDFRDRRFAMPGDLNPCIVTLIEGEEWRAQRDRRA
jgi:RimJ/RimL family protein N-acetyltransferase